MKSPKDFGIQTSPWGLYVWLQTFAGVGSDPVPYGLVAGQVSSLAALTAAYNVAYNNNNPRAKRTTNTALAFNQAKMDVLNYVRPLTVIIGNLPQTFLPALEKVIVGVNPQLSKRGVAGADFLKRTLIPVQQTPPVIDIEPVATGIGKLIFRWIGVTLRGGRSKKKSSARPEGAESCNWYYRTAPPIPGNQFAGFIPMAVQTRSPQLHKFAGQLIGTKIWCYAVWVSARGAVSGESNLLTFVVPQVGGI